MIDACLFSICAEKIMNWQNRLSVYVNVRNRRDFSRFFEMLLERELGHEFVITNMILKFCQDFFSALLFHDRVMII